MSITSAMYTGISGLNANSEAISVLGNNISNVNTVGFKNGRMLFSDVLSSTIGNNSQIGRGTQIQTVQNNFSQGAFESTENVTDLAIQGDSFFIVKSPGEAQRYTRAGAFNFNKDKILVNPDGLEVLGYGINTTTGLNNGVISNIDMTNFSSLAPKSTSTLEIVTNLDSTATTPTAPWNPALLTFNPSLESNFSNSMTIYDSQGNPHSATIYYRKTADNAWSWNALISGTAAGTPGDPGDYTDNAGAPTRAATPISGTLTYSTAGILTAQTLTGATTPMLQPLTFAGGVTAPQNLAFDFGVNASTQFSSSSIVNAQSQNGYYQGSLSKIQIDEKGYVVGVYSNGESQKVAQIALARFASTNGLSKVGGTLFEETLASGQAMISDANSPGVGKVLSNSLEQSNVDMAAQFVKLIQAQRAFSANSKTITTSDEMTQELLNLKR